MAQRIKDQAARPANSAPLALSIAGVEAVATWQLHWKAGNPIYLALGDSLTAGVGVTDKREEFATLCGVTSGRGGG